jgi:hypothetical protein
LREQELSVRVPNYTVSRAFNGRARVARAQSPRSIALEIGRRRLDADALVVSDVPEVREERFVVVFVVGQRKHAPFGIREVDVP